MNVCILAVLPNTGISKLFSRRAFFFREEGGGRKMEVLHIVPRFFTILFDINTYLSRNISYWSKVYIQTLIHKKNVFKPIMLIPIVICKATFSTAFVKLDYCNHKCMYFNWKAMTLVHGHDLSRCKDLKL